MTPGPGRHQWLSARLGGRLHEQGQLLVQPAVPLQVAALPDRQFQPAGDPHYPLGLQPRQVAAPVLRVAGAVITVGHLGSP
jgi:hypothetical protein